ncbi:MAG: glycosyltransferase family 39 protein [Cyanobacteria bacterium]|nr:glycosyltransferase family 39 protein [Cyanobacteriota bacterium]
MTRLRRGYGAAGPLVACVAAIGLATFGITRGTWSVGGSDSSCYGLMAKAMAGGELQPHSHLADAPWPDVPLTLAPGGFIPSPIRAGAPAPICAPGMAVLMAPLAAVFGHDAIFWLTPIAAFLLVIAAFAIARQLAGGMAGATAAILTASSPIVLYQAVQPMNDILTAALWMLALAVGGSHLVCGVLIGLAILVRPNLAPLALVLAAIPFIQEHTRERQIRGVLAMIAGALPGVLMLMWLNQALYGSVIGSGYGDASNLFSTSHINTNVTNYSRAIFQTQHVVPLFALLAPFVFDGIKRKGSLLLLGFAAAVFAIYALYSPFPEWWYLRFLIPAIVVLLGLASAAGVQLLSKAGMGGLIPIVAVVLGLIGTRAAGERQAFELQRMEGRYRDTAMLVRDRLPANAVVITVWESGSIRFHAGREVVLWESLDPAWLDRAITWLRSKGKQPYLLFERREENDFRARFRGQSDAGALDWPPRFDVGRQIRIYDPADRARYLAGEAYPTENIRR